MLFVSPNNLCASKLRDYLLELCAGVPGAYDRLTYDLGTVHTVAWNGASMMQELIVLGRACIDPNPREYVRSVFQKDVTKRYIAIQTAVRDTTRYTGDDVLEDLARMVRCGVLPISSVVDPYHIHYPLTGAAKQARSSAMKNARMIEDVAVRKSTIAAARATPYSRSHVPALNFARIGHVNRANMAVSLCASNVLPGSCRKIIDGFGALGMLHHALSCYAPDDRPMVLREHATNMLARAGVPESMWEAVKQLVHLA